MLEQFLEFVFLLMTCVHIQKDYMFSIHGNLGGKIQGLSSTDLLLVHSLVGDPRVVSHGDLSLLSSIYNCSHICNSVELFRNFLYKKEHCFLGIKDFFPDPEMPTRSKSLIWKKFS
jgi:hypothetical protein